ncbi:hypothetical protein Bbelb_171950 [Branchiostoma belcheri]|nr:hypothetical protein Bbelb_171950 [Branchiostoma belcheri]
MPPRNFAREKRFQRTKKSACPRRPKRDEDQASLSEMRENRLSPAKSFGGKTTYFEACEWRAGCEVLRGANVNETRRHLPAVDPCPQRHGIGGQSPSFSFYLLLPPQPKPGTIYFTPVCSEKSASPKDTTTSQ